jgi:FixJ family two-component response regulator
MNEPDRIVYVVDDDGGVCEALAELLSSANFRAVTLQSAAEYIAFPKPDLPACLVLDAELPDINGPEFQRQIVEIKPMPIVFITEQGDIPSCVRAIKAGAVDFLTKPFRDRDLLEAVDVAIARDRTAKLRRADLVQLQQRYSSLTPREREVLPLVVSGLLNKQSAWELGISEITLQIHRSKVMHKMAAKSLADLVRLAAKLEVPLLCSSNHFSIGI